LNGTRNIADSLPLPRLAASRAQQVIDRLVLDRVRGASPAVALQTLEHWRGTSPVAPRSTAITYALIGDTLLAFTVSDSSVQLIRTTLPHDRLRSTIDHVTSALELRAGRGTIDPDLERLHVWLIAPIQSALGASGSALRISTSDALTAVPFAALL